MLLPAAHQHGGAGPVTDRVWLVRSVLHGCRERLGALWRLRHRVRQHVAGWRGPAVVPRLPRSPLPAHCRPVPQTAPQPRGWPAKRQTVRAVSGWTVVPPAGDVHCHGGGHVAAELLFHLLLWTAGWWVRGEGREVRFTAVEWFLFCDLHEFATQTHTYLLREEMVLPV